MMGLKTFNLVLLVLFANSISFVRAELPSIYIEGNLSEELHQSETVVHQRAVEFQVWLDSPLWTIRVFDTDLDNPKSYGAYGSDGRNVYHYGWDDTVMAGDSGRRGVVAWINEGQFPLTAPHQRPFLVWFVFCSAEYFQTMTTDQLVPAPWATPRNDYSSVATEANLSFLTSGLPGFGEFMLTSRGKEEALERGWVQSHNRQRAEATLARFSDEFTLGRYQVLEIERIEDYEIPIRALAEFFFPDESGLVNDGSGWKYTLTVSDIRVGDPDGVGGPIRIPEGYSASIYDTRLKDPDLGIDFAYYRWRDESWPTEIPEAAFVAFEQQRESSRVESELQADQDRGHVVWVIGLIIACGLIPAVILFLRK
jgi:hypothetical protein